MKGSITISAPTYGNDKKAVNISIRDPLSRTRFITVEISYDQFTTALMGLAETPCDFEVSHLDRVGKERHSMELKFPIPDSLSGRDKELACKEVKKICPEGWEPMLAFSSQGSFFQKDGVTWARTTAHKWT